jgi:predicted aminopeptidase
MITLFITGCSSVGYYSQGIKGHLALMSQRQDIKTVIQQPGVKPDTRKKLKYALEIRRYATQKLGLPDNDSYLTYVDLKRKYVTWNVVATEAFSMQPRQWCFPVTGCISYRGYFREAAAKRFANQLRKQDYEVFVAGSSAYSTLGWFSDPIVSPMLEYGDIILAQTMFHELAHQQLYFKDDSVFNEAFASTVGEYGARQWLKEKHPKSLAKYNQWITRRNAFYDVLRETAIRLRKLYASKTGKARMKKEKNKIYQQLHSDYARYKKRFGNYSGFDFWFDKPVNNPRLALVSVYQDLVPDFARWLKACDGDFPRFYTTIARLNTLTPQHRHQALKQKAQCALNP